MAADTWAAVLGLARSAAVLVADTWVPVLVVDTWAAALELAMWVADLVVSAAALASQAAIREAESAVPESQGAGEQPGEHLASTLDFWRSPSRRPLHLPS